jgi:spermidine synthase
MTEPTAPSLRPSAAPPFLPVLLILFIGSGCSALVYEIVWLQMLQLVIGSSAVSLGVLLGTFMGGMCLGSLALPRFVSPRHHPLRVYALLEAAIGGFGLLILFCTPLVFRLYAGNGLHGLTGILLRGLVGAVCLLPPTLLMGATLPAIARWLRATPEGVSWLGFFYAGNIAGAVFGCLLAGFYLLRVHDMAVATYIAVAINAAVAAAGLGLAALTPRAAPESEPAAPAGPGDQPADSGAAPPAPALDSRAVYIAIALSGATALGAEVIWTRLLSLMLGTTVYTFSIILAVFLVGLGIGSSLGSLLARGSARPQVALGVCQLLLTLAIAWAACMLARSLPYWPIDHTLASSPWHQFPVDIMRCVWATLPATILWGASFPLALAAVAGSREDTGRLVGGVYAANTVGAIVGAVGTSVVLVGLVGTQDSQRLLIGLSALAGFVVLVPPLWRLPAAGANLGRLARAMLPFAGPGALGAFAVLAALLAWSVAETPPQIIAYGRYPPTQFYSQDILYVGEGMNSSVAVLQRDDGIRSFHVQGRAEASNHPGDMRVQRMLGHLPALVHPRPRSVLVVGCGAGVTAGSFVVHPDVERIVICEIEPLIPRVVAQYFKDENYGVLEDPRVEVVYDDARHYLLTTKERFDIITSDPIHPWVKGSATLYTEEYFQLVKQHLNPGGVVTQWVPLYESSTETLKSEFATFFAAFPDGTVWGNDNGAEDPDVVLMGQLEPAAIDLDGLQQRLAQKDHAGVAASLADVGFNSVIDLLATYGGRAADLEPWLEGADINRDRNLRLQYLAGMGLNAWEGGQFYADMIASLNFPEDLFVGSSSTQQALSKAIERFRMDRQERTQGKSAAPGEGAVARPGKQEGAPRLPPRQ